MIRLSCNLQGLAADIAPTRYAIPGLLGRFGIPEQFAIFPIYDAFVDQEIQIDGLAPVALAHQTTGIGLILRVCMSASTSNTLSNVRYPQEMRPAPWDYPKFCVRGRLTITP